LFDLFFRIYSLREFISLSLAICYCLIVSEDEPDKEILKDLDFIRDNTHEKLKIPLSISELIILTNYGRNIGKLIEFRNNEGMVKEFTMWELIKYSKESYFRLAMHVVKIAKKYSLDIPMKASGALIEIPMPPPEFAAKPVQSSAPAAKSDEPVVIPLPNEPVEEVPDLNPTADDEIGSDDEFDYTHR